MNTRTATHTLTALGAAAALTAILTGCNPSGNTQPTETIGTCTECTAAPTPTATSTTLDGAAKEKTDRAAAEAVWRKFVSVLYTLDSIPAGQVPSAVSAVAVDPTASLMLKKSADDRAQGRAAYGLPIPFISWPQPINGGSTAVLSDCQDGSQAGDLDVKTGSKLTVGTVNTLIRGTLTRTSDGWRVASSELVKGTTCTPEG